MRKGYISPALATGIGAMVLAIILSPFDVRLAAIPLLAYVLVCVVAPFFASRGFFLPVNSRGHTGRPIVALSFDDGPDPVTTPLLLQLLGRYGTKASFFVTGERAARYGDLIEAILAHGHDICNHSYSHDPFLMLRPSGKLLREITSTQSLLKRFGIVPIAFRPPVGITSPRLAQILQQQGLQCVNFTCRAFDCGNRLIRGLSERILKKVTPDDIILLHDIRPRGMKDPDAWLHEIDRILAGLKNKGLQVVPLAELLGGPLMARLNN